MKTLFLKYRPQTFSDLVGQEAVKKTLQNALKSEHPAHAYLFSGSRGTGKTSMARIFAKGLNCENSKEGDPCCKCHFCLATADGSLIDVIEIDAASNRGIDEIRSLREKINFLPSEAKRKVYIIDEVHMLTKEAFNALLKTLEEPPEHAYFCLATTEIHKIPETIISRCQTFIFQRFNQASLVNRLAYVCDQEKFKSENSGLELIAQKSEGGMRDAISFLEQISVETGGHITENAVRESLGLSSPEMLEKLYQALRSGETQSGLSLLREIGQKGHDFRSFAHDFLVYLRNLMVQNLKDPASLKFIIHLIETFETAIFQLKSTPIIELPLEIAIIKITQTKDFIGMQEIKEEPEKSKKKTPKKGTEESSDTSKKPLKTSEKIANTANKKLEESESKGNSDPKSLIKEPPVVQDFSVEELKSQMENIVEKSGIPLFAKRSFLTTKPHIQNGEIIFYTDSDFHREKLINREILTKIKGALSEIFGTVVKIDFVKSAA